MALFSRRVLQRIIYENSAFLSRAQCDVVCGRLNKSHAGYLATEWEQAILNAASKVGSVTHERTIGKTNPDLIFNSANPSVEFIADITAASDLGYENDNPVEPFDEEFRRHLKKRNLLMGGFDVRIDADSSKLYRGSKERVRLKLPRKRSDWREKIFNRSFLSFLQSVGSEPERNHQFDAVSDDTGVHISYNPARRGFIGGSHLAYTIATHLAKNPVYHALKEKGDQLKAANWDGMAGIFLCDGDCQLLTTRRPSWSSYSVEDIIRYFLRQFDSVSFLVLFTVKEVSGQMRPAAQFYKNPKKRFESVNLEAVLDRLLKAMPIPETTPFQARHAIKSGRGLAGRPLNGMTISNKVEMSARELLEILAGKRTIEQFEQNHSFSSGTNPFARELARGRLISRVTIQHVPEHDDDRVTIEFGTPDPAISPLRSTGP